MIQRAPVKMAIRLSTHLHPFVSPRKPPTMGPRVGPMKGAAAKTDMARPRCDAGNISAITPPAFVKGDEPNAPAKNRRIIRVWMFCEPAAPALKAVSTP